MAKSKEELANLKAECRFSIGDGYWHGDEVTRECSIGSKRSGAFTSGVTVLCNGLADDKLKCPIWSGKCVLSVND